MFQKNILVICCMILGLLTACKKKTTTVVDPFPYIAVNYSVYPNDPLNFKLQVVGGWKYFDGVGVNGIIVYRQSQNGASDFIAIERTSTYLPSNADAKVKVQSDNFTLKDSISGSKWQLNNGAVISGPASLALKQYSAVYDNGTGILTIRN